MRIAVYTFNQSDSELFQVKAMLDDNKYVGSPLYNIDSLYSAE